MSKNDGYFEYKGYHTRIEFDYESMTLNGKIEGIDDLILFESEDATKIEQEFHIAVDDYLAYCEDIGKTPEKEYKGVFNVRVSPETHRNLAEIAFRQSRTLNSVAEEALETYINSTTAPLNTFEYMTKQFDLYSDNEYTLSITKSDSSYSNRMGVS